MNPRRFFSMLLLLTASLPAWATNYVVSTRGNDLNPGNNQLPLATIQRAFFLLKPGDKVLIKAGVYPIAQPLMINDKAGTAILPISVTGESGAILRAIGEGVPGIWRGLFEINNSSWVSVNNLAVENSSFFGFRVMSSQNITIANASSKVSLGSGIYANDVKGLRILSSDVSRFCDRNAHGGGAGCQEGISLSAVDGFTVWGNKVHDAPQSVGVMPGGGEGIDIKAGSRNGTVAFNKVWNLVQLGIYIDGWAEGVSNVTVYGNQVWKTHSGIAVGSEAGGIVSGIGIHDNIVHDVGYDGILIHNYASGTRGNGLRKGISIYNNTIINAGVKESKPPYCVLWSAGPCPDFGTGVNVLTTNLQGLAIFDNIISGSKTTAIQVPQALRPVSRVETNLIWPAIPAQLASNDYPGLRPVLSAPAFISTADPHLNPTSPAIAAGSGGAKLSVDADNRLRVSTPVDLGALAFRL